LQISAKFDRAIELLKILDSYRCCENWKLDRLKVGIQYLAGFLAYWQANRYPHGAEPGPTHCLLPGRKVGNTGRIKGWRGWEGMGTAWSDCWGIVLSEVTQRKAALF